MRRTLFPVVVLAVTAACQPDGEPARPAAIADALQVLIVTDESDRMTPLAHYLKEKGDIDSTILDYPTLPENERVLPDDMSPYHALIGYIHNELNEPTELKIIDYTQNGGRFVAVHHMVSSGKATNEYYFDFLGLQMDGVEQAREPSEPGTHYMWREPVEKTVVNLAPDHYVTRHDIDWPETVLFKPTDVPGAKIRTYPAIAMDRTEVYSNVKRTDGTDKTLLLGYIYSDERNNVTHAQATDGWIKSAGKGHIVYLQPGHFVEEFSDPDGILNQLILNAVSWNPAPLQE
jgi:hypothetical protein